MSLTLLAKEHQQVTLGYPQSDPVSQLGDAHPFQGEIFPSSPVNGNIHTFIFASPKLSLISNLDSSYPRSLCAPHIRDDVIPDHQSVLSGDIKSRQPRLEK